MHLGSLLIGIAIGSVLTLAAGAALRRPRRRDRFEAQPPATSAPAPPPPLATPRRPPPAPLTLDPAAGDDLLSDLLERNRRLSRDTAERVRRGTRGPVTAPPRPAPEPAAQLELDALATPDARLSHLHELNRRLEDDARRRLSR